MAEVLRAEDLHVRYRTKKRSVQAVSGVSFSLEEDSVLCLVGESGAGKSSIALALMGLLPRAATEVSGRVHFAGMDLMSADQQTLRAIRGKDISMIPQEPKSAFNPLLPIGIQVEEQIRAHTTLSKDRAVDLAIRYPEGNGGPRPQKYPQPVSLSAQRRHVSANNDSHGPRPTSAGANRRRTHVKPGCDIAGRYSRATQEIL